MVPTCRSEMRRATHASSSACGIVSKYFDKSASTTRCSLHTAVHALCGSRRARSVAAGNHRLRVQLRLEDRLDVLAHPGGRGSPLFCGSHRPRPARGLDGGLCHPVPTVGMPNVGRRRAWESSPVAPAGAGSFRGNSSCRLRNHSGDPGDLLQRHAVHSRRPVVGLRQPVGVLMSLRQTAARSPRLWCFLEGRAPASLSFGAALSLCPHPSQGSLGDEASSASFGSSPAFPDSCPSPALLCFRSVPEAGPFAPPELPGFPATMALSDFPPGPPSWPRTAE